MVKVGNSECEFLKLTPLSRSSAMAGAVCGVTILPRRPSGRNRVGVRGVAFCAEARPAVDSVIRLADNNTMARRIFFSPFADNTAQGRRPRLVLRRDSIVTSGRESGRRHRETFPRRDFARALQFRWPSLEER